MASSNIPLTPAFPPVRPGDDADRCAEEQARCLQNIMDSEPESRWYPALGWLDWGVEKQLLLDGRSQPEVSAVPTEAKPAESTFSEANVSEETSKGDNRISALILANLAMIVTVIFGAGVTYSRIGTIEVRVTAIEAREAQLDALSAIQAELKILKEEMIRARDRLDRAVDATSGKAFPSR